ncbi:MAG: very short patch repair endonuclease [Muribaculaceae bacterium]|nr:very short patch repair endonuclease [Muribaculaceae bacterium]
MADRMTPDERSRCMAAVKGRDTRPEIRVRKYLFAKGLRYRINVRQLPGSPDIVLKKYGVAVFVDGCFWHGHEGCRHFVLPRTNADFWRKKIELNRARDYRVSVELRLAGWRVIRVWECEVNSKDGGEEYLELLYEAITGGGGKAYGCDEDEMLSVAEPLEGYGSRAAAKKKRMKPAGGSMR